MAESPPLRDAPPLNPWRSASRPAVPGGLLGPARRPCESGLRWLDVQRRRKQQAFQKGGGGEIALGKSLPGKYGLSLRWDCCFLFQWTPNSGLGGRRVRGGGRHCLRLTGLGAANATAAAASVPSRLLRLESLNSTGRTRPILPKQTRDPSEVQRLSGSPQVATWLSLSFWGSLTECCCCQTHPGQGCAAHYSVPPKATFLRFLLHNRNRLELR